MSGEIRIGVAGWSYPDWRGVVYPRGCRDELGWVARYVDFVELNTTFYRVPTVDAVESWVERSAASSLPFTAKLPREVSHERRVEPALVDAFARALDPLIAARRLEALLAQFNFRFQADRAALDHLGIVARAFGDLAPLVVELRHASWRDAIGDVRALGFSVANLDYPMRDDGFDGGRGSCGPLGYFRIHGRNRAAWYTKGAGRDAVYDYEYSPSERDELLDRVRAIAGGDCGTVFVVANNHFRGNAVKLALELKAASSGERVGVPDPLLAAHPSLGAIARGTLF
ncbi:MAG: DUF72 domain-containing protein [Planctomycetes bacterium]|nr:DUF72 domain-containing protein [Planctomycetota bacterium]